MAGSRPRPTSPDGLAYLQALNAWLEDRDNPARAAELDAAGDTLRARHLPNRTPRSQPYPDPDLAALLRILR